MKKLKLVTVFINPEMYFRFFTSNKFVNNNSLIAIDNRQLNRGLPVIYNEVIENLVNENCWIFFVHEDFEIKCGLGVIDTLDQNFVYGTFGINIENFFPVGYGKHVCSNKDGSNAVEVGMTVSNAVKVQTLDCQSVLVHTSLLSKNPHLRFDEKLTFDLYAEDFCINSRELHKIEVKVFPLSFQHYSHGNLTERYYSGLKYLAKKYPTVGVAGSCSFIGGNTSDLEKGFKYGGNSSNSSNSRKIVRRIFNSTQAVARKLKFRVRRWLKQ